MDVMSVRVCIIDSHAGSREKIAEALARHKIDADVADSPDRNGQARYIWVGHKEEEPPEGLSGYFTRPVRVGTLLERVGILQAARMGTEMAVLIGPYIFDSINNELRHGNGEVMRLTDKEKDILLLLGEARGAIVSRETLLEKVWAYAPNLETHTLETHIYRLRQKIEKDPARPEILLTDGSGYKIFYEKH